MSELRVIRLVGPRSYGDAYTLQREAAAKLEGHSVPTATLLLLQHTPVYTLGRATRPEHLTGARGELKTLAAAAGAEVVESDRGGSVTYHGPGQLTAYLLLNLKAWEFEIHRQLWNLETAGIRAAAAFGLAGRRREGMTGVWVEPICDLRLTIDDLTTKDCALAGSSKRQASSVKRPWSKLCAVGIGCRRWVTYHGLSLNVDLDLGPFDAVDPCGLGRQPVTSLAKLLGRKVAMTEAEEALIGSVAVVLGAEVASRLEA